MQSGVLLDMRQLLESPVAVSAFIWFFTRVYANVLNELMIAAETLQTLLTLVRFNFAAHSTVLRWWPVALNIAGVHGVHSAFVHENLLN